MPFCFNFIAAICVALKTVKETLLLRKLLYPSFQSTVISLAIIYTPPPLAILYTPPPP